MAAPPPKSDTGNGKDDDGTIAPGNKNARFKKHIALIQKHGRAAALDSLQADKALWEARTRYIEADRTALWMTTASDLRHDEKQKGHLQESNALEKAMDNRLDRFCKAATAARQSLDQLLQSKIKALGITDRELVDALTAVYISGQPVKKSEPPAAGLTRDAKREQGIFEQFCKVQNRIKELAEGHPGKGNSTEEALLALYERAAYTGMKLKPGIYYSASAGYQGLRDTFACAMSACARHAEESKIAKLVPELIAIQEAVKAYGGLGAATEQPPPRPQITPKKRAPDTGGPEARHP